jgi:ADP-dependent NAD(P)H-hydrate dehydratase / NAD(P)H-hydrate epimerase
VFEGDGWEPLAEGKTVLAMGPGLGRGPEVEKLVARALAGFRGPMVLDADALLPEVFRAGQAQGLVRVLTPHPGEMSRLTGRPTAEIQQDRVEAAREFASSRGVILVLKGQRTVIGFPDGQVWINPTGTPAMGKGGSGDILTGLITGFVSQFPSDAGAAVAAAVYLHGLAGELGAKALGDKCLLATDLLHYLSPAIQQI